MADRYWVGGTGDWSDVSHWSATSGGAGGETEPTSSDAVFFNGSSGGGTVTLDVSMAAGIAICASFNGTGFTGTITDGGAGRVLRSYGAITFGSGMGNFGGGLTIQTFATSGSHNITTNGITFPSLNFFSTAGVSYTLQDNLTVTSSFLFGRGTIDLNGFTLKCATCNLSNVNLTRVLTFGSGTIEVTGSGGSAFTATGGISNLTINVGTGTIKMTNTGAKTFAGAGATYPNFWHSPGAGTGTLTITGANTFANFKDDGSAAHQITLPAATTTTVTSWTVNGASCSVKLTLRSSSGGSAATISDTTGTNTSNYLSVQDITGAGGATWNFDNSTNVSGNSGITFTACPPGKSFGFINGA